MSVAVRFNEGDPQGDLVRLAESIDQGIALCSDGEVHWANSHLAQMMGRCSAQALVGARFRDFFEDAGSGVPSSTGWRCVECLIRTVGSGSRKVRLQRIELGGPGLRELWVVAEGAPSQVAAVKEDGETWKERSALEVKNLKELLDFVGHELRTPLTVIQGYNRLLLSDSDLELSEKQRCFLVEINRNCLRMSELLARIERDSALGLGPCASVHLESASIEQTIETALGRMKPALEEADLTVSLRLDPRVSRFEFDPSRIEQVFVNLLENSSRYASGSGQIEITSCSLERAGAHFVEIAVSDSGPGIPEGDRDRVFDSGFRLDRGNNFPGSGLGLYIGREIMRAHGGNITVVDSPSGGSCFVLTLPWGRPPDPKGI